MAERHHLYRGERYGKGYMWRLFWWNIPRAVPTCRVLGHVQVDHDGWAECARCKSRLRDGAFQATADPSVEIVVMPPTKSMFDRLGWQLRVGSRSSENRFAGHLQLGLVSVYVSLGDLAAGISQRLNTDDESRVTGLAWHGGALHGEIWAKRNSWSRTDPGWQHWNFDPADKFLGRRVYTKEKIGEPEKVSVQLPEGPYQLILQREHAVWKRPRWPKPLFRWSVDIEVIGCIPDGDVKYGDDDGLCGCSVNITGENDRAWKAKAIGYVVSHVLKERARHRSDGWTPSPELYERMSKTAEVA